MNAEAAKQHWWPEFHDRETARKSALQGVFAAGFVSAVTGIISVGGWLGAGPKGLIDAGLFAAIAFGIYRMSRIAAILGLLIYLTERIFALTQGQTSGGMMALILTLYFIISIRATFAYHRMQPLAPAPNGLYIPPKLKDAA